MANDYATLTELKSALPNLELNSTTPYDTRLTQLLTAASRALDLCTLRQPGAFAVTATEVRRYDGNGLRCLWVDEMAEAPTLVEVTETGDITNYTTWASTEYFLYPYNAPLNGMPYMRLDLDVVNGSKLVWYKFINGVRITAKFGYATTVPATIKDATIMLAGRWWKRGQQAFQDKQTLMQRSSQGPTAQEMFSYLSVGQDKDVAEMIRQYKRSVY